MWWRFNNTEKKNCFKILIRVYGSILVHFNSDLDLMLWYSCRKVTVCAKFLVTNRNCHGKWWPKYDFSLKTELSFVENVDKPHICDLDEFMHIAVTTLNLHPITLDCDFLSVIFNQNRQSLKRLGSYWCHQWHF